MPALIAPPPPPPPPHTHTHPPRCAVQTYEGLAMAFNPDQVQGVQEEVQLREQDFGNFQVGSVGVECNAGGLHKVLHSWGLPCKHLNEALSGGWARWVGVAAAGADRQLGRRQRWPLEQAFHPPPAPAPLVLPSPPPPRPPVSLCRTRTQDAEGKKREKAERLRFGRFFYRFPNGESGADVYDRCAGGGGGGGGGQREGTRGGATQGGILWSGLCRCNNTWYDRGAGSRPGACSLLPPLTP